jgi:PAS domain S-box-containing protein
MAQSVLGASVLEGHQWLQLLWDQTSDAMALSDETGIVLAANSAYHRLYGFGPDEVLGKSFAVIFPDEQRATAEAEYKAIFGSAEPPPLVQSTVVTRDRLERVVEVRVSFVQEHGHRKAMLSVVRDVTEEVAARREAEHARAELRAFLFSLSHDIKSPLAVIKGHAQVLRRQLARRPEPPSLERLVHGLVQIEASALRVAGLVDDLVEVATVQDGESMPLHRSEVELVSLARETIDRHQRLANYCEFLLDADPDSIFGFWDGPRLGRVLDNLIGNAIKYSPDGGLITVQLRLGCLPAAESDENACANDSPSSSGVLISVEDNGIGIAAEDLPHVFDGFHRGVNVPDAVGGTGIGLTSVAQIVRQHGGTIDISSGLGSGTRVTIWLPFGGAAAVRR